MSLFETLFGDGRKPDAETPAQKSATMPHHAFTPDRDKMFDQSLTQRVRELLEVPNEERGDAWYPEFFTALWNASIELPLSNNPFMGPDQFDYMRIDLPAGGSFEPQSLSDLAEPCVHEGCGAALYARPTDGEPAYIIPMGVLESLLRYGEWRGEPAELTEHSDLPIAGPITFEIETRVELSPPDSEYLSENAAFALDRYLKDEWKMAEPRVQLMVSSDMCPARSLIINMPRSAFADEEEAQYFGQCVIWFLPPSRVIILLPEDWNEAEMVPLANLYTARATDESAL